MTTYEIIWEFTVSRKNRHAFEAAYKSSGSWAVLFGKAAGYIETKLLRDLERDETYVTIDRWSSEEDFLQFRRDFAIEYHQLDRELEGLSERERRIGVGAMAGQ